MPTVTGAVRLDADEERVTRAQRLLIQLGAALVHHPFDTDTHDRLRAFLDQDVAAVLTSLRALQQRPEAQLQKRIAELAGHHVRPTGGAV
ncbi:hypothetical protein AB0K43_30050 [Kitasatospora sp. NPDC049258]|uniref:hypothetical protein n=1 Tax=Kitasatospora sp. NPDC049258 TaxID=3155394 RepID=UPI00342A6366